MDDNLRGRFRATDRRDYVGPMPTADSAPSRSQHVPELKPSRTPTQLPVSNKPQRKKKSKKKKIIIWITVALIIIGAGFAYWKYKIAPSKDSSSQASEVTFPDVDPNPDSAQVAQQKTTVRLVATGDMIAHGAILEQGKQPDGTYKFDSMLTNMKPYFEKADLRFCNQATPAGGASFGYTGYPVFNAPLEWPKAIEGVGCNVVNLGTNHTNDKGQSLIDATAAAWDKRPNVLAVAGANRNQQEQDTVRYFDQAGKTFAFISYTTYTNSPPTTPYGINMYSTALAKRQLEEARAKADFVIVSMRWGTEYSPNTNAAQDQVVKEVSSYGADVILGHGPHVLQPVRRGPRPDGGETIVWYSLGNFLNAQIEPESLIGGFAIMDINLADMKVAKLQFMPTYMHYEWTAAEKASNNLLARRNFSMYALDQAAEPMSKSQIGTDVSTQTSRVKSLLNAYTPVEIITSAQY